MKPYRVSKWLVVGLMGVVIALIAGGLAFFRVQQRSLRIIAENDLLAVAQAKIDQIVSWRENQLAEGVELMSSIYLKQGLDNWINRRDATGEDIIRARMQALVEHYHYQEILLLSEDGRQLMSFSGNRVKLHPEVVDAIDRANDRFEPVLSDIHSGETFDFPHITLIVPMALGENNQTTRLGYFLFVIDANDFLYPLIQSWPLPSETAETLLVRRDGDDALFLNELRHMEDTALRLRIPLTETDVPATKAIQGETGIVEGQDYRGIPVIAAILPVPDTEWFMISKIDQAESLSVWRTNAALIMLMILGAVGTASGFVGIIWQRNAKHHYLVMAEAELARRDSEERHNVTLMSVGDGVIVTDPTGCVQLMNPVAENLTGWKRDEALGRPLKEIFHIINEGTRKRVEDPVKKVMQEGNVIGLANHTLLISRDGREIPIADSGAPIRFEQEEVKGVVLVFRDQSEEHEAQHRLEESEKRFRTYYESSPTAISLTSPEGNFIGVNRAYCEMTGYTEEEITGKSAADLSHPEDRQAFKEWMSSNLTGEQPSDLLDKRLVAKNGEEVWVAGKTNLITDNQGTPMFFLSHWINTTHQKAAEEELRRSEERFRLLAESAPEGFFVESNLELVYVNPAAVKLFSAKNKEELLNTPMLERFVPEARLDVQSRIQEILSGKSQVLPSEQRCIRMNGEEFDAEVSAGYFSWEGKEGTLVFIRDISDRKRVTNDLVARENLLNEIFNVLPIGLWLADKNGKLIQSNPAGREIWGAEPLVDMDEYGVFKARRIPGGEEISADDWALAHTIKSKKTTVNELLEIDTFDGKKKTILNYTAPVLDINGDLQAAIIVNLDITDKQKVEDDLRRSGELLNKAQEVAHVGSWVWHIPSNKLEWSAEMFRIFGIDRETFKGDLAEVITTSIHPDDREMVERSNMSVTKDKKPIPLEYRIIRPNGDTRTVWAEAGDLILDQDGLPARLEGIVQDISYYTSAQEAIEASEARYRRLFESAKDGILILEFSSGKIVDVNPFLLNLLNLKKKDVMAKELWEIGFFKDIVDSKESFDELKENGYIRYEDLPLKRKDGSQIDVEFVSNVYEVNSAKVIQCNIRDISERKQAEKEIQKLNTELEARVEERTLELKEAQAKLLRQERLAVLGQLAGSVSHELRNPLGVISNSIYILTTLLKDADFKVKEYLHMIHDETQRSEKIISDMLDFSKVRTPDARVFRIDQIIQSVLERTRTPGNIKVIKKIHKSLPMAYADPLQITQVLENLATNAYQTMTDGGQLVISAIQITREKRTFIQVELKDSGAGMTEEVLGKIYEPLFTTKPRGIGLGLPLSKSLIEENGGSIEVESQPGLGTTFTIYIPAYKEEEK